MFVRKTYFCLTIALLFASCGVLRKAESDFYVNYSKKLGVKLTGKEDKKLIAAVDGWLGVPYKYGGSARNGVDCSGLICALYKEAFGRTLPRSTSDMVKKMASVSKSELQCGDVLFFTIKEKKVSHAGMYLANGKFVHAGSSQGVRIASLDEAYWQKYYAGAARLPDFAPHSADNSSKPSKQKNDKPAKPQGKTQKLADDVIIVFDESF